MDGICWDGWNGWHLYWLVGGDWNMTFIFLYIGNIDPN